ncbi:ATPase [Candidatus Venteria ishoeyi]|uniref:ATPase n=1 Tax=Candidatus Venteria ishoeyi TaxID=1899563 RepID=A0A1H6FG27_9GAMM|nr:ATPase [Candidatus Venteria ishoeyi]MDM8546717.1 hypothetical protein [Candidatus Venteria ishoeyi]SEH08603.1 Uncharacterised protein [Candidatus Venteria ishoeyi]
MDTVLKKLLETEAKAEALLAKSKATREQAIKHAIEQSKKDEAHFMAHVPELEAEFLHKAKTNAKQKIAEMQRRYTERVEQLQAISQAHEQEALDAAIAFMLKGNGES